MVAIKGRRSKSAEMLQNWKEKPVVVFGSVRPWAATVFFCPCIPFLARISQPWNITVPFPKMKSTVPVILHAL